MANSNDINGICLEVFAKISAAISHEIKNTLAIINESAGLLDDMVHLVGGGDNPIGANRVQAAAETIMKQVNRSNVIMKNLNRFAHSGDSSPGTAPIAEVVELITALSARQAAMKKITVVADCPVNTVIEADLLSLEALLYLTVRQMYEVAAGGSGLTIRTEESPPHLVIVFLSDSPEAIPPASYPGAKETVLADHLQGSCRQNRNTFSISIPVKGERLTQ